MNLKQSAFRFRVWILPLIYFLGFWCPWQRYLQNKPLGTLWLAASTWLSRTSLARLGTGTIIVTIVALSLCAAGSLLRVWGTAYIGASVMADPALHAGKILASGPYSHMRNPLYLGHGLFALGVCILMPPSGALVFLVLLFVLQALLVACEEDFLSRHLTEAWNDYRGRVPRWFPRRAEAGPQGSPLPCWGQAWVAEIFSVGFTLCFAVLAWRYDSQILIQALIICYGVSLVVRALHAPPGARIPKN